MADWTLPFRASYRWMRVSRATGIETERVYGIQEGGRIERNQDTECKESGSVDAVAWQGIGADLVRAWLDATFEDGTVESVALGTFLPTVSDRSVGGAVTTSTVNLTGRLKELSDDMFGQAFSLPAGTNAVNYAAQICKAAGFEVIQDDSDYTLPERVYYGISASSDAGNDRAETKLAVVNDLLDRAGFSSASTDPMGRIVLRKYVEPSERTPSGSFVEGANARFLREMTETRDTSNVANRVYAVFAAPSTDEDAAGVIGVAEDDSGGEWSIQAMGRVVARKESYSEESTQQEADAKAAELLRTSQAVATTLNIDHVYAPVTVGDSMDVDYASQGIRGRYGIRRQTIDLGAGCLTESEVRAYGR